MGAKVNYAHQLIRYLETSETFILRSTKTRYLEDKNGMLQSITEKYDGFICIPKALKDNIITFNSDSHWDLSTCCTYMNF